MKVAGCKTPTLEPVYYHVSRVWVLAWHILNSANMKRSALITTVLDKILIIVGLDITLAYEALTAALIRFRHCPFAAKLT
jgi:hypothetical protein